MWREFNYFSGYTIPNFDKMVGNPVARRVQDELDELVKQVIKMM